MSEYEINADEILAEIHSEPLQNFLATVRRGTSSAGSTYVPALDAHLTSVNSRRTSNNWPLNRGDVIEVQGPAASGKSHFLYHMLTICLLPSFHRGTKIGGWGKAAVFFDTDGKFSVFRLHELLVSRLRYLLQPGRTSTTDLPLEDLASQCLESLHVFRPTSSVQLAITLLHLPSYHVINSRLKDKEIGILAIDSMSAFYWRDRYALEQLRDPAEAEPDPAPTTATVDPTNTPNPMYHVLKALQQFRISHRPVVLMSNWGLNPLDKPPANGEPASPFYRQHLYPFPAPFEPHGAAHALENITSSQQLPAGIGPHTPLHGGVTLPLHYHITLHPSPIDPFPASYSLADAVAQESMRAELVNRGEVRGLVRTPGEDGIGEFTFCIGAKEILTPTDVHEQGTSAAESSGLDVSL